MPRQLIDPGPFRYTDIHGPHRSSSEQYHVGRLLRDHGLQPARCEFALEEIPLLDLIESQFVEAYHDRSDRAFDYEAWKAQGAPDETLREEFAASCPAFRGCERG